MPDKAKGKVFPVNLSGEVYLPIKSEAERKRIPVRDYITILLDHHIKKREFAEKAWPGLTIDAVDPKNPNHIILRDKNRNFFDIWLKDNQLRCQQDESTGCCHTSFIWLIGWPIAGLLSDGLTNLT